MVDLFDYVLNQLEMAVMDGYIPGFQRLIFKSRSLNRGGGIGFYVRSGISTKIIEELSVFQDGIFESFVLSLVIQLVKLFGLFLFIGFQAVFLILIQLIQNFLIV